MVNLLGHHPRAIVFGVEPASIQLSLELSPEIAAKLPRLVELIYKEIFELLS
jgi:Ni,Fe-hydrogenase maturation factor